MLNEIRPGSSGFLHLLIKDFYHAHKSNCHHAAFLCIAATLTFSLKAEIALAHPDHCGCLPEIYTIVLAKACDSLRVKLYFTVDSTGSDHGFKPTPYLVTLTSVVQSNVLCSFCSG